MGAFRIDGKVLLLRDSAPVIIIFLKKNNTLALNGIINNK
jgi:hypothetical protein